MADILADFMEDLMDIIDETIEVANPIASVGVPPTNVEDYQVPLSSPAHNEAEDPNKQKRKRTRGSEGTYEPTTEEGDIQFKRLRLKACPNLVSWIKNRVGDPSISNPMVRDHLSECHRPKKDML